MKSLDVKRIHVLSNQTNKSNIIIFESFFKRMFKAGKYIRSCTKKNACFLLHKLTIFPLIHCFLLFDVQADEFIFHFQIDGSRFPRKNLNITRSTRLCTMAGMHFGVFNLQIRYLCSMLKWKFSQMSYGEVRLKD